MKRRVFSIFIALVMVLCLAPVASLAAEGAKDGNSQSGEVHGSIAPINQEYIEYVENGDSENGEVPSMLDLSYLTQRYAESYANSNARTRLPESYDLRDYGLVGSVPDQGNYGTCWAFGALGAAESSLMQRQFTSVDFSKKHLAWFGLMGDDEEEFFCNCFTVKEYNPYLLGGTDLIALSCLSAWKGPVYNYKMPYDSFDEVPSESLRYEADFHLQDCVYVYTATFPGTLYDEPNAPDIKIVKQLILENGAYEISYRAELYENQYFNESTSAIYHDEVTYADHSNLIVGWDDNYPKENFSSDCQPENDGAWLVRNSWGNYWGDEGYFWLSYEDKSIEMLGSSYTFEDKDNYAKNYQYDINGWTVSVAADDFADTADASKTAYISNIFTAEGNEQLEAVSFYTTDVGTEYEISVYTGVEDENPTSGTLAYSGQTGYEEYCGYHTIELDSAVALDKGTNFSIVVKLTNPEYAYPVAVEAVPWYDDSTGPQYTGNGGESYYSADGENWTDIVELGKYAVNQKGTSQSAIYTTNVCLKAFTNPLPESGEAIGNVDFSLLEGEVELGSELELSGAENIYYTVTPLGGEEGKTLSYTSSITIDEPCTVTAWGEKNGKVGNKVSKTFTKQVSQLLELAVKESDSGDITYIDLQNLDMAICFYGDTDKINLRPRGKDEITVNGTVVGSDEWSEEIALTVGEINEITVRTEGEGKEASVYKLKIQVYPFEYDYKNETIIFDDTAYTITDADGNELKNGSSVTPYITEKGEEAKSLTIKNNQTGEKFAVQVEQRPTVSHYAVNFEYETTNYYFDSTIYVSHSEDMSNPLIRDEYWNYEIYPEETIYIMQCATDNSFASSVFKLTAPERPAAPEAEIEEVGADYVVLSEVENGQYRISPDGKWQSSNKFEGLNADTEYTFEVRYACTNESFASFSKTLSAKTPAAVEVKVRYEAYGRTVCEENQLFTEGENVCYPATAIEELGYILSETDKAQGKTVTVETESGVLTADPQEIVFEVTTEIDPSDYTYTVIYWTEDGKKLESRKFNFTHTEELEISEIEAPEGYVITGMVDLGQDYAATLTYYNGKWIVLGKEIDVTVADDPNYTTKDDGEDEETSEIVTTTSTVDEKEEETSEIVTTKSTVDEKAEETSETVTTTSTVNKKADKTKAKTDNPTTTNKTKSPQTGDNSNISLWLALLFVGGGTVTAATIVNKKEKYNR